MQSPTRSAARERGGNEIDRVEDRPSRDFEFRQQAESKRTRNTQKKRCACDLESRPRYSRPVRLAKPWPFTFQPDRAPKPGLSENVPSWRRPADPARRVKSQLITDLEAAADKAEVLIGHGDPVAAIVYASEKENCDLIVTGIARNESLGVFNLGGPVRRIVGTTPRWPAWAASHLLALVLP